LRWGRRHRDLTRIAWPCKVETNIAEPLRAGLKATDPHDASTAAKGKTSPPAAPKANGENGASAPKANGEIGAPGNWGVTPMSDVDNGEGEDWLLRYAREVVAERRSPNGKNGKAARRNLKRQKQAATR
jgi:hypothetical protein